MSLSGCVTLLCGGCCGVGFGKGLAGVEGNGADHATRDEQTLLWALLA